MSPLPLTNEPPWIHTITGRGSPDGAGVHTLKRQAVLVGLPADLGVTAGVLDAARSRLGGVAHPVQAGAGAGGCKRNGPTGGAA